MPEGPAGIHGPEEALEVARDDARRSRALLSLPDAELGEDEVQDVLGDDVARDGGEGGVGVAQVRRDELVAEALRHRGAGALQDLAARFDVLLEQTLAPARYVAFGAERVFAYLWQLFRENRNLRAALGGFAGRIEPELVVQSIRGENG